jgi:chromosome partitioning protein
LVASDSVLIPVQCEYYAIEGLGQLLKTVNLIKKNLKSELEIIGALMTMYDKRIKLSQEVVWETRNNFPHRVFETVIPRNIRLAEAPSFGETVFTKAPLSKGATAYKRLANEIISIDKDKSSLK